MGKKRTRKSVRRHEKNYNEERGNIVYSDSLLTLASDLGESKLEVSIDTTPQEDLLKEIKKDKRRFLLIILFSLFLHLSAVTIFKIVVYVPRSDLQYIDMKVIQVESPVLIASSRLRISGNSEDSTWRDEKESIGGLVDKIELPRLEFEEMKKLSLRRTLVDEADTEEPIIQEFRDSWAQFGMGVSRIRESLSALSPFREPSKEDKPKVIESIPILKHIIGNNVEITYRCLTPPYHRQILSIPLSFDVTSQLEWDKLQSYEFMVEVNYDGSVTKVTDLSIESSKNFAYIEGLIKKIKFEPVIDTSQESGSTQQITLRLRMDISNQ